MIPTYVTIALLALVCGASDRMIGWGVLGRSKPVIVTFIALAVIGYWLLHLPMIPAVIFPLAFLAWRTPPWELLGGSIAPKPGQELGTLARHLLAGTFLIPALFAHFSPRHLGLVALAAIIFAATATILAVWNSRELGRVNGVVETVRGAFLGAFIGLAYTTTVL